MGISWKSVVSFFSGIGSCFKPPPTQNSHVNSTNVPPSTPRQLPRITDPDQLNHFITYIEGLLRALKESSHQSRELRRNAGKKFSPYLKFAADTMKKISSESEKHKNSAGDLGSHILEEAKIIITDSLKGLGNLDWIGAAFSIVAFVLESIDRVSSNKEECIQLLEKIAHLAKILQPLSQTMSDDDTHRDIKEEKLKKAVHTIVDGAIMCCSYIERSTLFRYLTTQTVAQSLKDTRHNLQELILELNFMVTVGTHEVALNIQKQQPRLLKQSQNILQIADPVGMEASFEKVEGLLDMGNRQDAKAVIIYGFGGSGKTTLAEYVVSKLPLEDFKLCVVRIDERSLDIKKLQEQILFRVGGQNIIVTDSIEGKSRLRDVLKDQLCFILIDNITDKNQIKDLLPQDMCLKPGSRMLLTSRKADVKEVLSRNIRWEEYPVEVLPKEKAVELLHKIVFSNRQDVTSEDERKLEDIAEACGGVPLLLTVYGRYLSVHWGESVYEEALDSLSEERGLFKEEDLSNKLLYVYHQMKTQDVKDAFVEICTFFHGWQKRKVSAIVGEYELKSLQEGALVRITESDEVIVHDVLRSIGIKEGRDTRLQSAEDLCALLDDTEALRKVKGVWLQNEIFDLDSKHLNKMSNSLRILNLGDGIVLKGQCEGRKFKNLRCLIVVEASKGASKLERLAHFPFKDASKLERLAHVTLNGCQMLDSLPPDFGGLRSLKCLEIYGCSSLTELPREFGQLASLTDLELRDCARLNSLPETFGELRSLKCLVIHDCPTLTELPRGFGRLASLTDLILSGCSKLERVSSDFECLASLRRLQMFFCPILEEATMEKVVKLKNLMEVQVWGSKNLEKTWEKIKKSKRQYSFSIKGFFHERPPPAPLHPNFFSPCDVSAQIENILYS